MKLKGSSLIGSALHMKLPQSPLKNLVGQVDEMFSREKKLCIVLISDSPSQRIRALTQGEKGRRETSKVPVG